MIRVGALSERLARLSVQQRCARLSAYSTGGAVQPRRPPSNHRPSRPQREDHIPYRRPSPSSTLDISRSDKDLLRDIIEAKDAAGILAHYSRNKEDYDFVALATALSGINRLSKGVQPWKRHAVDKAIYDALVNHVIEGLGDAMSAITIAENLGAAPPSVSTANHQRRAIITSAFALAKLNRLPPVFCDNVRKRNLWAEAAGLWNWCLECCSPYVFAERHGSCVFLRTALAFR